MTEAKHLVFFAVPQEGRPLLRKLLARGFLFPRVRRSGLPPASYVYGNGEIVLVITGMGAQSAEAAAKVLLADIKPDLIWTCGFAGGLAPELRAGDIVYDADNRFPALLPGSPGARLAKIEMIRNVAVTVGEKRNLRAQTGADAVEMESGVIRAIARERGIPAATVRVISDTANEDLPLNFNELTTPNGSMDFGKLALALLRAPGRIPRLIRFGRQTSMAAGRLAEFLANGLATARID